jgi:hypothetical protein
MSMETFFVPSNLAESKVTTSKSQLVSSTLKRNSDEKKRAKRKAFDNFFSPKAAKK